MSMTSYRKNGIAMKNMCRFTTKSIRNYVFAIFMSSDDYFGSTNCYHNATAPILLHYVRSNDAASWNRSKSDILQISRPRTFKWGITYPHQTTQTTMLVWVVKPATQDNLKQIPSLLTGNRLGFFCLKTCHVNTQRNISTAEPSTEYQSWSEAVLSGTV